MDFSLEGSLELVFESKISNPRYEEFQLELAVYALACERQRVLDINYAIVLHANYPQEILECVVSEIPDSDLNTLSVNLERFLQLIQISQAKQSGTIFRTWQDLVLRPSGLPKQFDREVCESCRYKIQCYSEGSESAAE